MGLAGNSRGCHPRLSLPVGEWSGVELSGMEWNGVEWGGVEWGGAGSSPN